MPQLSAHGKSTITAQTNNRRASSCKYQTLSIECGMARPSDEPQPSLLDYFYIEALEDDSTLSFDNWDASYNLSSSFDKLTWTAMADSTIATGVNTGTKVYVIGNTTTLGSGGGGLDYGCRPISNKKYKIGGKLFSLYSAWLEPKTLTNMNDVQRYCFQCSGLIEASVDISQIKNARCFFQQCFSLSSLQGSNFADATDTSFMFADCTLLTSLPDGFTCPNATHVEQMFYKCKALTHIPTGFNVSDKAQVFERFFIQCSALSSLPDGFNCPNMTEASQMFKSCNKLTTIGNNVKIANGPNATSTDNTEMNKSKITTIGDNFEWFTNATFSGTWDPALGIRNVFPNATAVGSGWKVYNHYDGE